MNKAMKLFCYKEKLTQTVMCMAVLLLLCQEQSLAVCKGRFLNPMTHVAWGCVFPIYIGPANVSFGAGVKDTEEGQDDIFCVCPKGGVPMIGVPITYWEPVRLVDVVREGFCLLNLNGLSLGKTKATGSHHAPVSTTPGTETSFYHFHWYAYPLLYWLELLGNVACVTKGTFDLGYMSEFDPTHNDDEMAFILNPEAVIFANPLAQLSCVADCISSTAGKPLNWMFYSAGCHGSLYPLSGTISHHSGGVLSSLLLTERFIAKGHRLGLLQGTSGKEAYCGPYFAPKVKKTQYRFQLAYPKAATSKQLGCHPFGKNTMWLESGREYPRGGEDFGWVIWRKRSCCLL